MKKVQIRESAHVDIDAFLNGMISSRIARRVIAEQHVKLHEKPSPGFAGIVNLQLKPSSAIHQAFLEAADICDGTYGLHPTLMIQGDEDARVCYIPSHLHFVLVELFKNSMRAVVETHAKARLTGGAKIHLPPIKVLIVKGTSELTLRISDAGGGIPKGAPVFRYGFTTATESPHAPQATAGENVSYFASLSFADQPRKMFGFGFGLPLSKLYLEYLGGGLTLVSMEGYGTDAYITLKLSPDNVLL